MNNEEKKYSGRGGWRGGVRPFLGGSKKDKYIQIRCTDSEKESLKTNAKKAGKNISQYILDKVL